MDVNTLAVAYHGTMQCVELRELRRELSYLSTTRDYLLRIITQQKEEISQLKAQVVAARKERAVELTTRREKKMAYLKRYHAKAKATRVKQEVVYVILDNRGRLKVGKTNDIAQRLKQHRTSLPDLSLFLQILGYTNLEKKMQQSLCDGGWHIAGEWFRDTPETRAVITKFKRDERKAAA